MEKTNSKPDKTFMLWVLGLPPAVEVAEIPVVEAVVVVQAGSSDLSVSNKFLVAFSGESGIC